MTSVKLLGSQDLQMAGWSCQHVPGRILESTFDIFAGLLTMVLQGHIKVTRKGKETSHHKNAQTHVVVVSNV
jgi:hypothetical protein